MSTMTGTMVDISKSELYTYDEIKLDWRNEK